MYAVEFVTQMSVDEFEEHHRSPVYDDRQEADELARFVNAFRHCSQVRVVQVADTIPLG